MKIVYIELNYKNHPKFTWAIKFLGIEDPWSSDAGYDNSYCYCWLNNDGVYRWNPSKSINIKEII